MLSEPHRESYRKDPCLPLVKEKSVPSCVAAALVRSRRSEG